MKKVNPVTEKIVQVPAEEELSEAYLEYTLSVVYSRAIPSIDGLKPVQRRIIYGMNQAGWTHDKNFVKVSRITGEIMGRLHPHGDSSISDALVKLEQPFYLNLPLVEGYGNFGDVSGSSAAAARYIEAKLSAAAQHVVGEVGEDAVDFRPNYDGTIEEPTLLPITFPLLLVNGNSGIGVGFSNKIPPHNLGEVIDATIMLLENPEATLEEVMTVLPGPDFPTGAEIIGIDGIKQAYETGRGIVRIRATADIQPIARGKHEIIFSELPYGIGSEAIITRIKECLKLGRLEGLADAQDLTDRKNGLKIVVETKAGVNPQALLLDLYKETKLEDSFGINNTVIIDGHPEVLGLMELLSKFIDFRKETVIRRTKHRKQKRAERLWLIEGLLAALANIDEVIRIIRGSDDAQVAKATLMKDFKIDEVQADYILSMALRRLTKFDSIQLEKEKDTLAKEVSELDAILSKPKVLIETIVKELAEIKKAFNSPRRSVIVDSTIKELAAESRALTTKLSAAVKDGPCHITLLSDGTLTLSPERFAVGGGVKPDLILSEVETTRDGKFVAVTNFGNGHRLESMHVSEGINNKPSALGIPLKSGEKIIALGKDGAAKTEAGLALGTKNGVVKVVNSTDYPLRSDQFEVMALQPGDEIIGGGWVADANDTHFVFVTTTSSLLRFEASKVRPQGRTGGGVAGIRLGDEERAVTFAVASVSRLDGFEVVTVTNQSVKRSLLSLFPVKGRATGGVRSHTMRKGEEQVMAAGVASKLVALDSAGRRVDLPDLVRRDASGEVRDTLPVMFGSA